MNRTQNRQGQLRIIGGRWRSRMLPVIEQPGLRPTPDRVRETLFNWLQAEIPGSRCLDLFTGSGALGFEAASRGAEQVTLLENQPATCHILSENIKTLSANNIELLQQDALVWLNNSGQTYHVVFVDPPYDSDFLAEICQKLEINHWLSDRAFIYIELSSEQELPELPPNWQIIRGKKAGQVGYYLAQREV
ncbi:MAG: 16S rRNA (guanine(966)-N(2))-methyltransferase RsmD [Gammaproteobacteria bacterium]